jgi:RHS repeat-associated protein
MYYRHSDWLGNSRLTSTTTKPTSAYFSTAYAPFGEQYKTSGTPDASFTGQDQSTVSDLYDFQARRQSPSQGRWISPDPVGRGATTVANPQSWNRYAYVLNNPLNLVDPLGLDEDDCNIWSDCTPHTDDGGGGGGGDDDKCDAQCRAAWDQMNALWWDSTFSAQNSTVDLNRWNTLLDMMYFGNSYCDIPGNCTEEQRNEIAYGDPCVYAKSDGSFTVNPNISGKDCINSGGHWVPPGDTYKVSANGNVTVIGAPWPATSVAQQQEICAYWKWGNRIGWGVVGGLAASGVGTVLTVPLGIVNLGSTILQDAWCSSDHW